MTLIAKVSMESEKRYEKKEKLLSDSSASPSPQLIQRWGHAEVHLSLSTELTFLEEGRLGRRVQLSMAQEL